MIFYHYSPSFRSCRITFFSKINNKTVFMIPTGVHIVYIFTSKINSNLTTYNTLPYKCYINFQFLTTVNYLKGVQCLKQIFFLNRVIMTNKVSSKLALDLIYAIFFLKCSAFGIQRYHTAHKHDHLTSRISIIPTCCQLNPQTRI